MEFCSHNLKNVLNTKHLVFNRNKHDHMSGIEYFISCKIFIEILLAVEYLHGLDPPIIHRDLKPSNILFDEKGETNGIFIKLCDFGLAKYHEDKTHTKGLLCTPSYVAPEVYGGRYDTKADVYSLGITAQRDIFELSHEK